MVSLGPRPIPGWPFAVDTWPGSSPPPPPHVPGADEGFLYRGRSWPDPCPSACLGDLEGVNRQIPSLSGVQRPGAQSRPWSEVAAVPGWSPPAVRCRLKLLQAGRVGLALGSDRLLCLQGPMESPAEGFPAAAVAAVLKPSAVLPEGSLRVRGYDFGRGLDHRALLQSYLTTGFQATSFGQAVQEINRMIAAKLEPLGEEEETRADLNPCRRQPSGCTIFLGFTSNLISSGIRETIRYLVQHNMVDVLVTTAGGVEEDLIKCLAPTYVGEFSLRGKELRESGINRIGNLLVPNDNYCKFEDWLMPILDQMVAEQNMEGVKWTPSKMIARLGKEMNNPESVYYWAQKNNIPVLSPALTDGSLGDMIFFHSYKNPGLVLDIVEDLRLINTQAIFAKKTGMIILGGGLVKHHIANANLMRNGADYAVYVNTAQEFDGSDSGARPDEAVSWGKIRIDAKPVKVYADASLVFPLLVAETFAQKANAFVLEKQHD